MKKYKCDLNKEVAIKLQNEYHFFVGIPKSIDIWFYVARTVGGYRIYINSGDCKVSIHPDDINGIPRKTNKRKLKKFIKTLVKEGLIYEV